MQWRSLGEFPIFKETGNGQEGKEEGQEEGRQEKEEESITTLGRGRRDVTPGPSPRGCPVPMRPTIEISTLRGRKRPRGRFCVSGVLGLRTTMTVKARL